MIIGHVASLPPAGPSPGRGPGPAQTVTSQRRDTETDGPPAGGLAASQFFLRFPSLHMSPPPRLPALPLVVCQWHHGSEPNVKSGVTDQSHCPEQAL